MNYHLEDVEHHKNLPISSYFHSGRRHSHHWHRDIEFLLIINGAVLVQSDFQEHLLRKGDLYLIGSGDIHITHEAGDNNLMLVLQVDPAFIEKHDPDITRREFDFNNVFSRDPDLPVFSTIRKIMATVMWEMRIQKHGYAIKIEGLVNELFSILLREFTHTLRGTKAEEVFDRENADNYPRIRRIIQLVEKKYDEKLSLAEIAEKERLSLGYLSRFFKEKTGCKFTEYVNLIRVKKSLPELAKTDRKITDIALDTGFADVKAYNTFFKRTYKTTPSKWRNEHRKKPANPDLTGKEGYFVFDPQSALSILKQYISGSYF
jgi:xylan 1,4-beta-xylosidase